MFWGSFAARQPARNRARYGELLRSVAAGALRPRVDAALPLADAAEALGRLERRAVKGKLVLVP